MWVDLGHDFVNLKDVVRVIFSGTEAAPRATVMSFSRYQPSGSIHFSPSVVEAVVLDDPDKVEKLRQALQLVSSVTKTMAHLANGETAERKPVRGKKAQRQPQQA